jgi:hypothetical protein
MVLAPFPALAAVFGAAVDSGIQNPLEEAEMRRNRSLVAGILVVALAGCRADRETFEGGATLETPPEVQQAPAMPIPPQPMPGGVPSDTTLPPVDPDTITAEDIRPPS